MLDLEILFSGQTAHSTVPKCAQENAARNPANDAPLGGRMLVDASNHESDGIPLESLNQPASADDFMDLPGRQVGHSGHNGLTPVFDEVCPAESLRHKAFEGLGTLGTVGTVDFQEGEGQKDYGAPGGGAARNEFALHPAAVILALAYSRKVRSSKEERAATILHLETLSPGDQVKYWHSSCVAVGLKPWEVLLLPAPASGLDCTLCKHLITRQVPGDEGRRQFHWACGLGYLILETGRATERIWIAPPDCQSYERWVPDSQTSAPTISD